jgi:hypothetical protein
MPEASAPAAEPPAYDEGMPGDIDPESGTGTTGRSLP